MRWLERYLTEGSPTLQHLAELVPAWQSSSGEIADNSASYRRIERRGLDAGT